MKLTKRKAFNFLRSYFDVLNELKDDYDKLDFLMSIINKQFLDEDPKELGFIPKLCYESQRHAIEKSVKGWKTANKTSVMGSATPPPTPPKGSPLPLPPKEEEVQEEVQEEEKGKYKVKNVDIDFIYSLYPSKCIVKGNPTGKSNKDKEKIKSLLSEHSKDTLKGIIDRYVKECKDSKVFMKNFKTFLNNLPDYTEDEKPKVDTNLVYYKWKHDQTKRSIDKSKAKAYFEAEAGGGRIAVIL